MPPARMHSVHSPSICNLEELNPLMTNSFRTQTASPSAPSPSASTPVAESFQLAQAIAAAADDRKGADITLLNVSDVSYLADYFVIITGFSNVQVRAIARSIEDTVAEEWQRSPQHIEGKSEARWVLLDYGNVIAHIFVPQEREFYNLEAFWGHAEQIPYSALQSQSDSVK